MKCRLCNIDKLEDQFDFRSKSAGTRDSRCKQCCKLRSKRKYLKLDILEKHCKCCNKTLPISEFYESAYVKDGYSYHCKDCRYKRRSFTRKLVICAKARSKKKSMDFSIKVEDIEFPMYCPILNIKLDYSNNKGKCVKNSPSLDRIDNSKGYTKDNVMIISRLANTMKNCSTFDQLELFCTNYLKIIENLKNSGARGDIIVDTQSLVSEPSIEPK